MEKYYLNLSNAWAIQKTNDEVGEFIDYDLPFGQFELKNGHIVWIMDPFEVQDETIEKCQKLDFFHETVDFVVQIHDDEVKGLKEVDSFQGTFIDALKYIKTHFKG
ncbi:MAG: hypothetical protein K5978_05305 [Campylobacter sp.]|nr:hypothetical protein [Campylobacter sp.]